MPWRPPLQHYARLARAGKCILPFTHMLTIVKKKWAAVALEGRGLHGPADQGWLADSAFWGRPPHLHRALAEAPPADLPPPWYGSAKRRSCGGEKRAKRNRGGGLTGLQSNA
jgi:hypothetical protein